MAIKHMCGLNMKFEYIVELKNGFCPVLKNEEETEVRVVVESSCRVNADRMIKAMLKDVPNVINWDGYGID